MLNQVADGVWVRQSEWVWTNSIVVRGDGGLILIDPGIHGSELDQLADDVADRAYIGALGRGEDPVDARLEQDWLAGPHRSNLEQARAR